MLVICDHANTEHCKMTSGEEWWGILCTHKRTHEKNNSCNEGECAGIKVKCIPYKERV
jgi:hypothetical protein